MGLSGISTWGSDIGGFFALFEDQLTPGAAHPLGPVRSRLRRDADGGRRDRGPRTSRRPQVWDPDQIANWRRYAKLRTQLYPYLVAADAEYQRTGLPIMRQLALAYPDDPAAAGRDDEFLFGPDLLAAPVLEPGAIERSLYLPRGSVDRPVAVGVSTARATGRCGCERATVLRGAGESTVPAPLDELPLLAHAGAVLPTAARRTSTRSATTRRLDHLARRPRRAPALLAFPRDKSSRPMFDGERISSRERGRGWVLRVQGERRRTYRLQASLKTL